MVSLILAKSADANKQLMTGPVETVSFASRDPQHSLSREKKLTVSRRAGHKCFVLLKNKKELGKNICLMQAGKVSTRGGTLYIPWWGGAAGPLIP